MVTALPPHSDSPSARPEWSSLGLSSGALSLVLKAGYLHPTPVQAESIPLALKGDDLIASAQTGTGKTASFVLPMVERFASKSGTFGLILCQTREIAQQTQATLEIFGTPRGLRSIVLIGGIDMKIDAAALQTYPQVIVATPGRLCDHLDRGNIWLDFIQMVVLDEADRMLDMGFSDQLSRIMQEVPRERQTLVFSATFPPTVERLASKILHNPKRVAIGKSMSSLPTIDQRLIWMTEESKNRELMRLFRDQKGSIIVVTRSKDRAPRLWRSLHSRGMYEVSYLHSDRVQADREQVLVDFKEGKYRILIATDVAGRGIHVDGIAHVINYDLPMEPEDYIHRIGRTGRQGEVGKATTFVTTRDRALIRSIEKILAKIIPAEYRDGVGPDSGQAPVRHGSGRPGPYRPGKKRSSR